jgi:YD repeat-containing protein
MKCAILLVIVLASTGLAQTGYDDPFYDYLGQNSFRESQPNAPREIFDPFTGNFSLVYTDLYLPGNGGLDLKIMRVYNSNICRPYGPYWVHVPDFWIGLGWSMHMGRLVYPENSDYRYLEMPDGSTHKFYGDLQHPEQWISKEYWILRQNGDFYEVLFPNGQKWVFDSYLYGTIPDPGSPIRYYPTKTICDPMNNTISIHYETVNGQPRIEEIFDSCNRWIWFVYQQTGAEHLDYIFVNLQRYHYEYQQIEGDWFLTNVRYPLCPSGQYDYHYTYINIPGVPPQLEVVQDKYGSETRYLYTTRSVIGRQYRVLQQRREWHGNLGYMNWNISYGLTTNNLDSTAIVDPYNTTSSFVYYGYPFMLTEGNNWKLGLMLRKRIIGNNVDLMISCTHDKSPAISEERYWGNNSYDDSVYVPRLTQRQYTIDGKTYTTNYPQFNDYSQPTTISETGDATRTINRSYWHNTEPYIVDRVASENIVVGSSNFLTTYDYNNDGTMSTKNVSGVVTTYTYHNGPPYGNGNLKRVTDNSRRWVEYSEYERGVPKTINKGGAYTINRTINWEGTIASETNGRGYTTNYQYDEWYRLTDIIPPVGDPTSIDYVLYNTSNPYKQVSRGPSWTRYYYDRWSRVDSTVNSIGVKVDYQYDAFDRKTYESYPYATTNIGRSFEYDCLDRTKRITNPGGSYSEYTYYQSKVNYRNELGKYTEFQYHAFGNPFADKWLASVKDALNQTTNYGYNAASNLTSISADGGYARTYHYNASYFMDYEVSPERGQTNYSYDNAGNLIQRTDANGNLTSYVYDGITRLKSINYPGTFYDVNYYFDKADNCTLMTTPTSTCQLHL